jgi:hypothetical protein
MNLPHQYPYNPRPRLILVVAGAGLLWIVVLRLSGGRMPAGFGLWFGLVPIILALVLAVRRASLDRRVLLDIDEMVLPTGLLQTGTVRVPYSDIQRVWRHYLPAAVVLRVATERRTYEIISVLLPNAESYRAIEDLLSLKAKENAANLGTNSHLA